MVELLLAEKDNRARAARRSMPRSTTRSPMWSQKQKAAGIDVINDGEQGRTDYTVHVIDRLTGFEGQSTPPRGTGEPEFPELAQLLSQFASPFQHRPACSGPVAWKDFAAAEADIARAKAAMAKAGVEEYFMTSPSPGQIARYLKNQLLQDRRGIPVHARRRDDARIPRHRRGRASSCSSIAPTSRCPTRSIPASASPTTARSSR